MASHQITTDRKSKETFPSIRVVARQSGGIPRVASESEGTSGPPACAERAGAESQSRFGVGCFLRGHMGCTES